MKIYIAASSFSNSEEKFNLELEDYLKHLGFETYLPERTELLETNPVRKKVNFEKNIDEIKKSGVLVVVLDGRVPDEGACVYSGAGYILGKDCVGIKTDSRSMLNGKGHPVIEGSLNYRIAGNFEELGDMLNEIKNQSKLPEYV